MKIDIITDNSLIIPEYIIDLKNKSNKTIELVEHHEKLKNLGQQKVDDKFSDNKENKNFYKKKNYKKKFFKKNIK
jgi:ribonuclease E